MTSIETQFGINQPTDILAETAITKNRAQLEQEKRRINEEINNYPPPIPACDAQFNYLLEERARILQELSRLDVRLDENRPSSRGYGSS